MMVTRMTRMVARMKVTRADPLFSIGCQLFAFLWKFYEGKNRILVVG